MFYVDYKKRLKSLTNFVLVLLCFVSISLIIFAVRMRPVVINYAKSNAESIFVKAANDAAVEVLTNSDFDYNSIVTLSRNSEGFVTSLQIDTVKVNYFKSVITNKIAENIAQNEQYLIKIPAGTFLGSEYFNGIGPDLKFKMKVTFTGTVDFKSEFSDAGINQVLHKIIIKIKVNGSLITAGKREAVGTKTSVIAAQTVIVGAVPSAFTQVIESENDNTAGLINDYGSY